MTRDRDERVDKRVQKEAAKLRGQADLTTKAWMACHRVAACAARVGHVSDLFAEGKVTEREFIKASRALEEAAEQQLAVFWAMDDDQLKQYLETLADFQKSKSKAKLSSI